MDLVHVTYDQTGKSKSTNALGMREMQEKAFEGRTAQYLLLKAPPASGKSRALMFIALDKLKNQGIKKVIVAVPERSIGASFGTTELKKHGFFADWKPNPKYNLCTPGVEKSKVTAFLNFLESDEQILVCTHATLRFAFDGLDVKKLDDTLVAIDEFHHVSAEGDNILGQVLKSIMANSSAHIVAMTGSYFRGDSVPVLMPEDEAKFTKVTYTYYHQLSGYSNMNYKLADFPNNFPSTTTHEFLHTANVQHTFAAYESSKFAKFTYRSWKTDNILDYSDIVPDPNHRFSTISLFEWQGEIAKKKSDSEP